MFTQPVSSPPPVGPGSPPSTSTRSSRLRGLSYLRTYTQTHLLSREHGSNNTSSSAATTPSTPPAIPPTSRDRAPLLRSASYSTPASPADAEAANVISLVTSHQEPLSSPRALDSSVMQPAVIPRPVQNSTQQPTSEAAAPAESVPATADTDMLNVVETTPGTARATGDGAAAATASGTPPSDALPSIRFSAYFDPRATRPSLTFAPIARTLPTGNETIRVGRYSERENQPNIPHNTPSAAPVGFKSKVVSRRHCEFWCQDGKWYIKDVKSSSGTFLNHIRLSPPGTESKPFPVNDGDIVQLGIDFKGGEEMIFRCVKMRLELNRGWQSKPNAFNMTAHKRLRNMASSANSTTSQDCSICLNSIAPCQSLFVAPCSHTWHYKCIRSLLNTPSYPIFVCPNCRMAADLEADIEDVEEDEAWEADVEQEAEKAAEKPKNTKSSDAPAAPAAQATTSEAAGADTPTRGSDIEPMDVAADSASQTSSDIHLNSRATLIPNSITQPLDIRPLPLQTLTGTARDRTPSPPGQPGLNGNEGPITPRNDAGPWVFDGSAPATRAGAESEPAGGMRSLDAATEMEVDS